MMVAVKNNPESEVGVLGTLIADGNPMSIEIQKSMLFMDERMFYNQHNKKLFNLISKSFENQQWFDVATLLGMTLEPEIHDIIQHAVVSSYFTPDLLDYHLKELKRLSDLRQQKNILEAAIKACDAELIPSVASEVIMGGIQKAGNVGVNDKMNEGYTLLQIYNEYLAGKFEDSVQVQCGIEQFGDIKNGGLLMIAGGSGVGKTFFSLYVMDEIIKHQPDKQFLFFSLEMKRDQIWDRYLTIKHDKGIKDINFEDRALTFQDGKVFDHPKINIDYIDTISRLNAMKKPISVIVVDYIGLVTTTKKYEREERISEIAQALSALAMDLNCTVIGLSQTNRDASKRSKDDRCPYPEDVAESTGSVRSSSLWIGIDRPELYDDAGDKKNLFVAKCRKTRHGDNFDAYFSFNNGRFKERPMPYLSKSQPKNFKEKIKSNKDRLNEELGAL